MINNFSFKIIYNKFTDFNFYKQLLIKIIFNFQGPILISKNLLK
jgi:hypothetical protein